MDDPSMALEGHTVEEGFSSSASGEGRLGDTGLEKDSQNTIRRCQPGRLRRVCLLRYRLLAHW